MPGRAEKRQESSARSRTAECRQAPATENDRGRDFSRGVSFGEAQGLSRGDIRSEAEDAGSFGAASGAAVARTFGRESGASLSSGAVTVPWGASAKEPVTAPPQSLGTVREASTAACSGDLRDMLDTCLEEVWNISRRHRAGEDWQNIATDIPATDRKLHELVKAMTQTFPGHDAANDVVRLLKDGQKKLRAMAGRSSYDEAQFNNAFDALMQAQKVFRTRVK